MNQTTRLSLLSVILLLFLSILPLQGAAAATTAGRVVFATGNPVATNAAGTERSLSRGNDVYAGDDLRTPVNSRLQISFVDGGFISLQPDSEYRIDAYRWDGKADGTENAVYHLIKGGIRAVTGLIGKEHHNAYKVVTSVATIGIRGTGFNTRICHGDCAGKPDGLYHSTWEGITYVQNNVQVVTVPSGRGVYVRSINSPIQFLATPPAVTAVQTATEKEEEQKNDETQTTIVAAGDQRNSQGTQTIVGATPSTVLLNKGFSGLLPDTSTAQKIDWVDGISPSAIFVNSNNQAIGILTTAPNNSYNLVRTVGTIDPTAMLNGNDAASAQEVSNLLSLADPTQLDLFRQNPATVAESTLLSGGLGWARWSGGNVIKFDASGETDVAQLTGYQSLHLIFGTPAGSLPASGGAVYNFIGGTHSTSYSGATLGNGVTGGFLFADFASSQAGIDMNVNHAGNNYLVAGLLNVLTDGGLTGAGVIATTTSSGSACNPQCPTAIEGGFAAPLAGNGSPGYAGIAYDIAESDAITGVAGFGLNTGSATTVTPGLVFTAVSPGTSGMASPHFGYNGYGFASTAGVIGTVFTDAMTGYLSTATVDVNGMLAGDNPTAVAGFSSLLGLADPALVNQLESNPAKIAESTIRSDGSGWGRWSGGNVLTIDSGGGATIDTLTGNQSVHFIFGPEPASFPTMGVATYDFAGGTRSTSVSGATIGTGVTGGYLFVNFADDTGGLDMNVNHGGSAYEVAGVLDFLPSQDKIFDAGVFATTTTSGSACNPSCLTYINGGFAGAPGAGGNPAHVGIDYAIQETDPITGVAGFDLGPAGTVQVQSNLVFVAMTPYTSPSPGVDTTLGSSAYSFADGSNIIGSLFTDSGTGYRMGVSVAPRSMLAANDPAALSEYANLLTAAAPQVLAQFNNHPATVAESQISADGSGWGRWTNGEILTVQNSGVSYTDTLSGNQSVHFIFGQAPSSIPTMGSATYAFAGGTHSTSISGATTGTGVTGGSISVNFGTSSATLNMNVDHNSSLYAVSGSLYADTVNNGISGAISASTSTGGSACNPSCATFIDGGFAGPLNSNSQPNHIGLGYQIQETDPIMGVAGFNNTVP